MIPIVRLFIPPNSENWSIVQCAVYIAICAAGFAGLHWLGNLAGGVVAVYVRGH
jgi:hypothetical protein